MPKLESPFVRKMVGQDYLVTAEIAAGMEWVFEDDSVIAIEKLHGTNVSVIIENGQVISIWNRKNRVNFFDKTKKHILEGLLEANFKGYLELPDGQWFGELIGKKVNGNPYQLDGHLWIPFQTYAQNHLRYKSWGKYPKDFKTISQWFQELMPLYMMKKGVKNGFVEGVIFTHPDGRLAKLRKDMFSWYKGKQH